MGSTPTKQLKKMSHKFQRKDVLTIIKSCNEPHRTDESNVKLKPCNIEWVGGDHRSPASKTGGNNETGLHGEEMSNQKCVNKQSEERLIYDSSFCRKYSSVDVPKRVKVLKIMQIGDVQILTRKVQHGERRKSFCGQVDHQKSNASVHYSDRADTTERSTVLLNENTDALSIVNNPVEKIKTKTTRSASCSASPYKHKISHSKKKDIKKVSDVMQTLKSEEWITSREENAKLLNLSDSLKNVSNSSKEALSDAALRLRKVCQDLENGTLSLSCTKNALQYAVDVLETKYLEEDLITEENFVEEDTIVPLQGDNVVPPEIKRWLVQTFSTGQTSTNKKRNGEKRTLRGVVHAVQAGMFVERLFQKSTASSASNIPVEIKRHLQAVDSWSFDVFELEEISGGHALKYTAFELFSKYGLLRKFKIDTKSLMTYCERLEAGYRKHGNKYHNPIHAADVTQDWLSDLEIFAMLFAAAIHDLEHTGTTNNFHTQTRSNLALLYNDRSVLENHHISAAFKIMWEDTECDILRGLNKEEFAEFRALVVEMVLATDMSRHVSQLKQIKSLMQHPEKWTGRLVDEFFKQGDRERELGLPLSPLCDRHSTMLAQSQIGFINYVIKPTYDILLDTFWKISDAAFKEPNDTQKDSKRSNSISDNTTNSALTRRFSNDWRNNAKVSANQILITKKLGELQNTCNENIKNNCLKWKEMNEIEQQEKNTQQSNDEQISQHNEQNNDNGIENT